jgi:hypothetical protein
VGIATGNHAPRDNPAVLDKQSVLNSTPPLVVEGYTLSFGPFLEPPEKVCGPCIPSWVEMVGNHNDPSGIEDAPRTHGLFGPKGQGAGHIIGNNQVATEHANLTGPDPVNHTVGQQNLLGKGKTHMVELCFQLQNSDV